MIWEKQWELFAPNFKDGKAHIDLTPYGCREIIRLYAGPGFGDHSHPTTRLVLRLMQPFVKGQNVIDIGCGSGILSFAAAAMGAKHVKGYDLDPEAVSHAQKNASLNPFQEKIHFGIKPPPKIDSHSILLMNMIHSEQAQAWSLITNQIPSSATLITSGILENDEVEYLAWQQRQGWTLQKKLTEEGWCGFVLIH